MSTTSRALAGREVLFERDDALAALHGAYSEARAGSGRLVLVSGEGGVGKTTLIRAFAASLADSSRVLEGACDPLFTPRPFAPFADVAARTDEALRAALRGGTYDVYEAVREELAITSVLVLEDLHWADEATLDVLRLLGRRIESVPSVVVGTYRDDELERTHPLRIVLGELRAAVRVEDVHLDPLSPEAVVQLASDYGIDAQELHRRTGGNPFYVHEVLEAGGDSVPETIRGVVLARAAGLSPEARSLVETVSLSPPEMEVWLLERVYEHPMERLDECLDAGVLVSTGVGVSFRHELARIAIAETVGPARRLAVHRRILDVLADASRGPVLARLAHHAEAAGDTEAVLRWAPAAARESAAAGAYREAAAQYARALRFATDRPPGERAALLEGRSRACYLADDQVEAIEVIQKAIASRNEEGAPLHEARDLCELTDYLLCRGLYTQARSAVAKATVLVANHPETSQTAYVLWTRSRLASTEGNFEASVELAREALELAGRCGDAAIAAHARITIGTQELLRDSIVGRRLLESVVAECRAQGLVEHAAHALNNLGAVGVMRYDHALADTFLPEAFEYCAEHNLDLWRINVLAYTARGHLNQGRWAEAEKTAALLLQDPRESPWPHLEALLVLALVRARRGDPRAREALDDAAAVGVSPEEVSANVDLAAAHAEVAFLERLVNEVDRETAEVLEAARERGATDDVARLSYWRTLAHLAVTGENVTGPYASGAMGDWERAADEWERRGCPYETALARSESQDEGVLLRALEDARHLGARPLAAITARRLRQLGTEGVPRGPRPSTRRNPAQLTARELEVLALVARGLRNAEIADALVVSKRTIDHHVSAILRKLGAHTRGEAAAEAARLEIRL